MNKQVVIDKDKRKEIVNKAYSEIKKQEKFGNTKASVIQEIVKFMEKELKDEVK